MTPSGKAGSPKSPVRTIITTPKQKDEIKALQYPISVAKALRAFSERLDDDEKAEMLDYKEIYFMGKAITKKDYKTAITNQKSYGHDDDKGDYNAFVGEQIAYRYEILDLLGKGSFGQVIKCYDHKARRNVALKIIRSKKRFYHQATVEVKLLKYIVDNDPKDQFNFVRMYDYFIFRKHICITFELLSSNLYDLIKENDFRGFPQELIRKFAIQILQSLLFLKEHSIIHCDLKPENILLRQSNKSGIKLIDLGSGCFSDEKIYTYIQSRFYRAPEIMLAIPYTCGIDMWSFGCILAELFTGFPIFPGESEPEQMSLIMEVLGMPPKALLEKATRKEVFFNETGKPLSPKKSQQGVKLPGSKKLEVAIKCNDSDFIDFLMKCLNWVPEKRMTPEEALTHKWIVKEFPQFSQIPFMGSTNTESLNTLPEKQEGEDSSATRKKKEVVYKEEKKIQINRIPESAKKKGFKIQENMGILKEKLKLMTGKNMVEKTKFSLNTSRNNSKSNDKHSVVLKVCPSSKPVPKKFIFSVKQSYL